MQEEPKVAPVLDSLSVEQGDVVTCAWNKAEEYYYGSLARLQRLMEVRRSLMSRYPRRGTS